MGETEYGRSQWESTKVSGYGRLHFKLVRRLDFLGRVPMWCLPVSAVNGDVGKKKDSAF